MQDRKWRKFIYLLFASALLLGTFTANAVSIDKIEVGSHLGEPFFAEAPLKLESNELASKVFVEIAGASDYKIFEVYRDPTLNDIRADVTSDTRGVRVKLTSRSRIKTPFLNLVLKIRYGRVSRFKKFPVFLDAPKSATLASDKQPQPVVKAVTAPVAKSSARNLTKNAGQAIAAPVQNSSQVASTANNAPDGWARTDRYGPIVRGDSLSIIAQRLRVDYRYSINQVMMAMFNKNPESFNRDNINLIKAGSYLKVPSAAEVEAHSKSDAQAFLGKQEVAWKQLTAQPRYAAEAEAQRTRYAKRISVGEQASGSASAPAGGAQSAIDSSMKKPAVQPETVSSAPVSPVDEAPIAKSAAVTAEQGAGDRGTTARADEIVSEVVKAQEQTNQILKKLQEQNQSLQQQLLNNQQHLEAIQKKANDDAATEAAAKARIEKLELLLTRLQSRLEQTPAQQSATVSAETNWMIWLLIAVVAILLVIVVILMRREPEHPAEGAVSSSNSEPEAATQTGEVKALESVIEDEVAHIETGANALDESGKTAEIDALASFTDELSDTDTTELDTFDAESEPDPDIDYLSEADVYIRYGMEDEAIKQLDMALKLQPDNVEAHIRKAELLLGKSDKSGLDETIAAATMTLTAVDLARYKTSIEKLGLDLDESDDDAGTALEQAQDTQPLGESATTDLDFALSDIDVPDIEEDKQQKVQEEQQQRAEEAAEEALDWLHDDAFDGTVKVEPALDLLNEEQPAVADQETLSPAAGEEVEATRMMGDLLSEFSPESAEVESEPKASEQASVTDELDSFEVMSGTTQELDSLLSEFSEPELKSATEAPEDGGATQQLDQLLGEFHRDDAQTDVVADTPMADDTDAMHELDNLLTEFSEPDLTSATEAPVDSGATQQLDQLLGEFDREDAATDAVAASPMEDDAGAMQELGNLLTEFSEPDLTSATEAPVDRGATQHLDQLLSEFDDDDDDLSFGSGTGIDAALIDQGQADRNEVISSAAATRIDHGATQELDHLLAEFADADELEISTPSELDASFFAPENDKSDDAIGLDTDHGATQALDSLLTEFADESDEVADQIDGEPDLNEQQIDADRAERDDSETDESGAGATQALGRLLDEVTDDEDDKKGSK